MNQEIPSEDPPFSKLELSPVLPLDPTGQDFRSKGRKVLHPSLFSNEEVPVGSSAIINP